MSQWSSTFKIDKAQQVAISYGEMHGRGMNSKPNLRCFDLNMKSFLAIYRCSDCMQCRSLHSLGFHHVTTCNVDLFTDFATSYAPIFDISAARVSCDPAVIMCREQQSLLYETMKYKL